MFLSNIDLPLVISLSILAVAALLIYLKANLKICEPNEILVFSGKKRKLKTGDIVGYRFVRGGIGLRTPLLERVSRLSLATIPITIEIERALSNGMIPLTITAIAHVKISSREGAGLENAVERLLGKSETEIETIARHTIEGTIRGVLATYTPEDANYRRLELEQDIYLKTKEELTNLGFTLDSIKIENLKDTQGYLDAVGRRRNALVQRDARITEAESEAEAVIAETTSRKKASDIEFQAKSAMEEYEVSYRKRKAELDEAASRLEAKAEYSRHIETLRQEKSLQEIKEEVNAIKYNADVIIPANAEKKADEMKAIGKASYLKEQGLAMADAVKLMKKEWDGGASKELFMLHILPNIVDSVSNVIADNLKVEKLVIMGDGGLPKHVGDVTSSVLSFLEQIKTVAGIDLTQILGNGRGMPVKKELE